MENNLVQLLNYATRFAIEHLMMIGIAYITVVFLAGYSAFDGFRPTSQSWYWWGYGFLGFIGYIGFALHEGHPGPVFGTLAYVLVAGAGVWWYLKVRVNKASSHESAI
jgi:hypothetical protein